MRKDRLTWFGLALAVLGWGVLILDLLVAEAVLHLGNLVVVTALRTDLATLAQTAILTGLGLALLGAVRRGFASLGGTFDAVFQPPPMVTPTPPKPMPIVLEPEPLAPIPEEAMARPQAQVRERNYVILPDGSVEVETLLGTRIFASLDEARDFIR